MAAETQPSANRVALGARGSRPGWSQAPLPRAPAHPPLGHGSVTGEGRLWSASGVSPRRGRSTALRPRRPLSRPRRPAHTRFLAHKPPSTPRLLLGFGSKWPQARPRPRPGACRTPSGEGGLHSQGPREGLVPGPGPQAPVADKAAGQGHNPAPRAPHTWVTPTPRAPTRPPLAAGVTESCAQERARVEGPA